MPIDEDRICVVNEVLYSWLILTYPLCLRRSGKKKGTIITVLSGSFLDWNRLDHEAGFQ